MGISHRMTSYGKEIYKWNFFKTVEGYKITDPVEDDYVTQITMADFNCETSQNTFTDFKYRVYLIEANRVELEDVPLYYQYHGSGNWPSGNSQAYQRDFDKLEESYLYRIDIDADRQRFLVRKRNNSNDSLDVEDIQLSALNSNALYEMYICSLNCYNGSTSSCTGSPYRGWYYEIKQKIIYAEQTSNENYYCGFKSRISTTNDYIITMYSTEPGIAYIPTLEMIKFNMPTYEYSYTDLQNIKVGPDQPSILAKGERTRIEDQDKAAFNKYIGKSYETGILNEKDWGKDRTARDSLLTQYFVQWFTISIPNRGSPFSVDLILNNRQYQFLRKVSLNDLENLYGQSFLNVINSSTTMGSNNLPGGGTGFRNCFCTFKIFDADENIYKDIKLPAVSPECRNELIPIATENAYLRTITNPIFYNHILDEDDEYDNDKNMSGRGTQDYAGLTEIGDFDYYIPSSFFAASSGCFLAFAGIASSSGYLLDVWVSAQIGRPINNSYSRQIATSLVGNLITDSPISKNGWEESVDDITYIYTPVDIYNLDVREHK